MGPFYRIILMSDSCIDFLCPRFICVKLFTERVPGQQSYSQMSSPGVSHGRVSGGHTGGGGVIQRALVQEPVPAPRVGHRAPLHGQARRALQQNIWWVYTCSLQSFTLLSCSYNWPQPLAATGTSTSSVSIASIIYHGKLNEHFHIIYLEDRSETLFPCQRSRMFFLSW